MLCCTGERLYCDGVQRWRGGLSVPPAGHRAEADRRELQVSHGLKLVFFHWDPGCCSIWIQSGFRPKFFYEKFETNLQKPSNTVFVLLSPYGNKNVKALQHEIYLILPYLVDNFGLPESRFGFLILQIRWSDEIRIHSVSGSETLNKTQAGNL